MMNDITKEQNGKNSKINNVVYITLRLRGSLNLVNLTFNCEIFKTTQIRTR